MIVIRMIHMLFFALFCVFAMPIVLLMMLLDPDFRAQMFYIGAKGYK